ncbi:MAG: pyridoxal phosphate-dependent aminotransferase [Bacteroidales bacterium]|nr:pyridoxal phosphate-dependent aminotransferase [Bacteroidales bacterium]
MTHFDFDTVIPRRGTDCVKWDHFSGNAIPMWVADMDFPTAPAILEALQRRLDHGIFGYEQIPSRYYDAITGWFGRRHGWQFKAEDIVPTTGVIAAYSACIKAMTEPGDKVILQTPVYNCFFPAVRNNRCIEAQNVLRYADGRYTIDFEDLERKAADPAVKVLLLCNPHNPVGRVWTREELTRIGEICLRHNVFVISDEIHCELTYPGHDYTPYGSLGERFARASATCCSPTKAFNIAGIQIANVVATDPEIRRRIDRALNENECCDVNVFGVEALMAAYNEGEPWLDALRKYLKSNAEEVYRRLGEELPGLPVLPLEGTYLMWLDCSALGDGLWDYLKDEAGVVLCNGSIYGEAGRGFLRLNIACPRRILDEGIDRLIQGIKNYNLLTNNHLK